MQRWLKRAGLILFFGLWAAAGLQIWAKKQESREMEAVAAFSNIGTDNRSGIVQYYGKLKKEEQVQMLERREEYLRQIAASLGISSQILVYRTYGEDSQSVVLQKEGAKRRYCATSCHLERKGGDHRTEPVCKRDYSRRRI